MPRFLHLSGEVGPSRRPSDGDRGQVQYALWRQGRFDPAPAPLGREGVSMPRGLLTAVRDFQRSQGLRPDGRLLPGGPTENGLNRLLAQDPAQGTRSAPTQRGQPDLRNLAQREDTPGALAGPVGPGLVNHPDDVAAVNSMLGRLGNGTTASSGRLRNAAVITRLRNFQRRNGLTPDGIITPNGPTEQTLDQQVASILPHHGSEGVVEAGSLPSSEEGEIVFRGGSMAAGPPSLNPASRVDNLAGQGEDDVRLSQANSDQLSRPPVTTRDGDGRFQFRPVPPRQGMSEEVLDAILFDRQRRAFPFPEERFPMLRRTTKETAEILGISQGRLAEAGLAGEQALRGVASSLMHTDEDRQILDELLTALEDDGHHNLASSLRSKRRLIHQGEELFPWLWPDERIREHLQRAGNLDFVTEFIPPGFGIPTGSLRQRLLRELDQRREFQGEGQEQTAGGT